jgi:hypothetical protein
MVGKALTVTFLVFEHPLISVKVTVAVPAETPVTNPLALTVATVAFEVDHAFEVAGEAEPVNCVIPLTQIILVPLTVGSAFTVNDVVVEHPLTSVYVIVVVPVEREVTNPVAFTVATAGFEDVHGVTAAGVPDPLNCVVDAIHPDNVPDIVGKALKVTTVVAEHPLLIVYVIVVVPGEIPVTKPVALTVATAVFEETHGFVVAGVPVPVNCVVAFWQTDVVPLIVGTASIVIDIVAEQPLASV